MAAYGPPLPPGFVPYNLQTLNLRCYIRYNYHDIQHGDEMVLSVINNSSYGTQVGVFQVPRGNRSQAYLRLVGVLDSRDSERLNHTARSQAAGFNQGRGGPRVSARNQPDVESCRISQFSPQYINTYPPNYGVLPAGGPAGAPAGNKKPYITLEVVCRQ